MFTGIVQEAAMVESVQKNSAGIRLAVRSRETAVGLKIGESVAVNGCCLTTVQITSGKRPAPGQSALRAGKQERVVGFDLLHETWKRTNLQFAKEGMLVNLELPLRADGRLDGHFVTGHIDGLGKIEKWDRRGADHLLEISASATIMRYIVSKGSIALDGISLTVAEVQKERFGVWIIPHTFEVTALRERKIGDAVNLETDILGKYVEKFVRPPKE